MEESKVEMIDGVRTLERDIMGKHYVIKGIKYRQLKEMKKTAGENVQLLNDMIMLEMVTEPKLTMADLDNFEIADLIPLQKAIAEVSGIDPNSVKGF